MFPLCETYRLLCHTPFRVRALAPLCTRSPPACICPASGTPTPATETLKILVHFASKYSGQFGSGLNATSTFLVKEQEHFPVQTHADPDISRPQPECNCPGPIFFKSSFCSRAFVIFPGGGVQATVSSLISRRPQLTTKFKTPPFACGGKGREVHLHFTQSVILQHTPCTFSTHNCHVEKPPLRTKVLDKCWQSTTTEAKFVKLSNWLTELNWPQVIAMQNHRHLTRSNLLAPNHVNWNITPTYLAESTSRLGTFFASQSQALICAFLCKLCDPCSGQTSSTRDYNPYQVIFRFGYIWVIWPKSFHVDF